MKEKTRRIILIIIYSVIVLSTAAAVFKGVTAGADAGQVGEDMRSWGYFKAFTTDSNVLCAIIAGISLFCLLVRKSDLPYHVRVLNLIGSVGVALTFIVVVTFLAPSLGWLMMFEGGLFHLHFLTPVLAAAALLISSAGTEFSLKSKLSVLIPIGIYGIVYYLCVMVFGVWTDFYGFSFGGSVAASVISAAVIALVSFGVACLFSLICRKNKKTK